jgi:hypothetical protein
MFYSLLVINAAPSVLAGVIWWIQRRNSDRLSGRMRGLFVAALIVNSVPSLSLYALICWRLFGDAPPIGGVVEDRLFLSMIGLGLLSSIFASFGRGLTRALLIANGILVAFQWWLLAAMGI